MKHGICATDLYWSDCQTRAVNGFLSCLLLKSFWVLCLFLFVHFALFAGLPAVHFWVHEGPNVLAPWQDVPWPRFFWMPHAAVYRRGVWYNIDLDSDLGVGGMQGTDSLQAGICTRLSRTSHCEERYVYQRGDRKLEGWRKVITKLSHLCRIIFESIWEIKLPMVRAIACCSLAQRGVCIGKGYACCAGLQLQRACVPVHALLRCWSVWQPSVPGFAWSNLNSWK